MVNPTNSTAAPTAIASTLEKVTAIIMNPINMMHHDM